MIFYNDLLALAFYCGLLANTLGTIKNLGPKI